MKKLIFNANDVRRVVDHSIKAAKQCSYPNWSTAPVVVLVHDEGVYLMSNGSPADPLDPAHASGKYWKRFVTYAKGCDPIKDKNWYDTAHDLVGGDDFAEYLPWAHQIKELLDKGASHIVLEFGKSITLAALYPKRRVA